MNWTLGNIVRVACDAKLACGLFQSRLLGKELLVRLNRFTTWEGAEDTLQP
jgi:hypothetical protein